VTGLPCFCSAAPILILFRNIRFWSWELRNVAFLRDLCQSGQCDLLRLNENSTTNLELVEVLVIRLGEKPSYQVGFLSTLTEVVA
jgi:hypothetical protein